MQDSTESPRSILKEYADTLIADTQASTRQERDEVADDLIEITGKMEAQGEEIAQLIYDLLGQSQGSQSSMPG